MAKIKKAIKSVSSKKKEVKNIENEPTIEELNAELKKLGSKIKQNTEEHEKILNEEYIPENQVKSALRGLLALNKKKNSSNNKNSLLNEHGSIFLQIIAIKIPKTPRYFLRIELPHNLLSNTSDVCLFVPDLHKGRKTDHEPTIEHYEDLLRSHGVKNIKTIIPMRQVKVEYDQFELRRKLLGQFDYFLADARISKHLNQKLGKIFTNKRKNPTPIRLDAKDLKKEIERGLSKTLMPINSDGDTFTVKIGHTDQKIEQITENILAAVKKLATSFPGKWENIRTIILKTHGILPIPIYISLRPPSEISVPVVRAKRPKTFAPVEGELSTYLNRKVKVTPYGDIEISDNGNETLLTDVEDDEQSDGEESNTKSNKTNTETNNKKTQLKNNKRKIEKDAESNENESDDSDDEENNVLANAEEKYLVNYVHELKTVKKAKKGENAKKPKKTKK
ncbi:ribosomal L1 domain-containing protein 1 [Chrysoperla carnea]|uniref:ribosomal L1 domain-containing protein 1 n=1 Tax=Chrysoperla carnea TaxID=189513 RepID=UPI001D076EF2|nr:ribosomal L1 domain-containing protein 1 [Chrysoperla carnea]